MKRLFTSPGRKSKASGSDSHHPSSSAARGHAQKGLDIERGKECFVKDFISGNELKAAHAAMGEAEHVEVVITRQPAVSR
jgi:hypothetical protein